MKINIGITTVILALIALISGCTASVTTNTTTPANTTKPAPANTTSTTNTGSSSANTDKPAASNTGGETINLEAAGVKMTVPKGLHAEKNGDMYVIATPDKKFVIMLQTIEDRGFDELIKGMAEVLDENLKDVKIEQKNEKIERNGFEVISSGGTGKDKEHGQAMVWSLKAVKTPKNPLLVTIIGDSASLETHQKDIGDFLESLKKQ